MPLRYENIIKDRLAQIEGIKGVYGASVLPRNAKEVKPPPCIYLVFLQATVDERINAKKRFLMRVYYQVQVVIRNLTEITNGNSTREDAQVLIQAIFDELNGWRPDDKATIPMQYEGSPLPIYDDGLLLFPMNFSFAYQVGNL